MNVQNIVNRKCSNVHEEFVIHTQRENVEFVTTNKRNGARTKHSTTNWTTNESEKATNKVTNIEADYAQSRTVVDVVNSLCASV